MRKKIFFLIFVVAIIRLCGVLISDNNYEEKSINKNYTGIITNLVINDTKTVVDIDRKYKITLYKKVNYNLGDLVNVKGVFKTPSNNTVPNLFNYRKYLLSKKIKMISNDVNIKLIKKNTNIFYKVKNTFIKRILHCKSNQYLNAFILGDTSYIDESVKQGYSSMGISHLFAISGMHVSVFLFSLNVIFKKFKHKNIVIFLFLMFFLFLTNFSESLLRCVLFLFLSKINKKYNLKIKNELLIVFEFLFFILINPYLIYNVGFIFSVVITFFIVLSSDLLKLKKYISKTITLSIICFFSSIPILSFSFFKINLLSIIYNVIFIPLISFFYFPFALITFIFPLFDSFYYQVIKILEWIILNLSSIKLLTFTISKPNIIVVIMYYAFLFLTLKINRKYIAFFILILIININSSLFIKDTEITFLDVGQGDSSIVILPLGKALLIDTGGVYKNNGAIAKNKIIPYLNSMGINKLDTLIITHGDYDHMADAKYLVDNIKIDKVIFNCGVFNELEQDLIKVLDKKKIPYYSCIKELNIDNSKLQFLNTKEYDNENDNSNVIYAKFYNYKFLFMGDASNITEREILDKYNLPNVDVFKAGHHGSKTSSSKELINTINPKYSIISVGKNNRYGHPNKEILESLNESKIYRTDIDGSIMFKIKNNKLKIETCTP